MLLRIKIFISRLTISLILLPSKIDCSWYFREAKACDPTGNQILPFTGFRIQKQFTLDGFSPPILSYISLNHCDHGVKDYEKLILSDNGLDWNTSFCLLKPRKWTPSTPKLEESNKLIESSSFPKKNISQDHIGKINSYFRAVQEKWIKKIEQKLQQTTRSKFIQYTGSLSDKRAKENKYLEPHKIAQFDTKDLRCFKMARRKKYAKQNQSFFLPYTWVGGLFECFITNDAKSKYIESLPSISSLIDQYDFPCDADLASPIAPLVAEDLSSQWIESPFQVRPQITQFVPYITTPSAWDLRFSLTETPEMFSDSWASEIEVNENYNFTPLDKNLINKAKEKTNKYLQKYLCPNPEELDKMVSGVNSLNSTKSLRKYLSIFNMTEAFMGFEQKSLSVLATLPKSSCIRHLRKLESYWDDIPSSVQ